jgi:hypothetical protein
LTAIKTPRKSQSRNLQKFAARRFSAIVPHQKNHAAKKAHTLKRK